MKGNKVELAKKAGIDVAEAYLFGSVVDDKADRDSDIDLAVVSRDFQGILYPNVA